MKESNGQASCISHKEGRREARLNMDPDFYILISFIIEGKNMNLKKITEELGIIPTETRGITDWPESVKKNPNLPEELKPKYIWCICQKEKLCKKIEEPIRKIVAQIQGKEEKIIEFCKRDGLKESLCITIHAETMDLPEIVLPADIVTYFGKLNVEISFDIYTY